MLKIYQQGQICQLEVSEINVYNLKFHKINVSLIIFISSTYTKQAPLHFKLVIMTKVK